MEALALLAVALCILASAAVSRRIQGTIFTLPMVYVALGLLVGSLGLGWVEIDLDSHFLRVLAELTLISVLASDASRINLRLLHGVTAAPGANWYGRRMEKQETQLPDMAEHQPVGEMPLRSSPTVSI